MILLYQQPAVKSIIILFFAPFRCEEKIYEIYFFVIALPIKMAATQNTALQPFLSIFEFNDYCIAITDAIFKLAVLVNKHIHVKTYIAA